MPRNIEIKAKIPAKFEHNLEEFHRKLTKLCGSSKDCLKQYDTFFNSDNGRLKLRQYPMKIGNGNEKPKDPELIFYERNDEEGPKLSDYVKVSLPRAEAAQLEEVLTRAYGVKGEVEKQRFLFIYQGQTRVHLDHVKGLGNFIEFEVCLNEDQSLEEGELIANKLKAELGIQDEDLLKGAYMDLLQDKQKSQ